MRPPPHAAILGIGAYRPPRILSNEALGLISPSDAVEDAELGALAASGIRHRRRAAPAESLAVMAGSAAAKALAAAGLRASQVDHVIVSTMSRLHGAPPVSAELVQRLSMPHASFRDINAVTAGFTTALDAARSTVLRMQARCVLVVGVERMFDIVDGPLTNAALFGDGAGAVVVGPSQHPGIAPAGECAEQSHAPVVHGESWMGLRQHACYSSPYLRTDGPEMMRWALAQLPTLAMDALDRAEIRVSELDAFIPHQANAELVGKLARALHLQRGTAVALDLAEMGNTSAASIPMAAEQLLSSGRVPSGGTALLLGFGAGVAHAAQVVRLP
jgi:3-oxoacyl-[acyl-carrier-protein] synthase-3